MVAPPNPTDVPSQPGASTALPRADASPAAHPWASPTPAPAPASMKGFLLLIGLLALLTTIGFLLLGDSWHHWFPRE